MGNEQPTRTDAQAISRDSEKIFERLLPSKTWNDIKIPQEKDYGLDYKIEYLSKGKFYGYEFYVQLKGFKQIAQKNIAITISTATLRYWKSKIIPILIVAIDCTKEKGYYFWFDKNTEIKTSQKTQTIKLTTQTELFDYNLITYLETYYGGFVNSFSDKRMSSFYKRFFYDSILMLSSIQYTLAALSFPPQNQSDEIKEMYYDKYINLYLMSLSKFIHDFQIYSVDLPNDSVNQTLNNYIQDVLGIYNAICYKVDELPGWGVMMVNKEKAYTYLSTLSHIFCEINQFFGKHLLKNDEEND